MMRELLDKDLMQVVGGQNQVARDCTCSNCGATVSVNPSDIQQITENGSTYNGFKCPFCGKISKQ